jgi:hypothetical protein
LGAFTKDHASESKIFVELRGALGLGLRAKKSIAIKIEPEYTESLSFALVFVIMKLANA